MAYSQIDDLKTRLNKRPRSKLREIRPVEIKKPTINIFINQQVNISDYATLP